MTDKQILRKYIKDKNPIGTEIWDWTTSPDHNGPYIINKRSVFDIYDFEYNDESLPDDPEDRMVEFLVHNPGRESVIYDVEQTTRKEIKDFYKWREERKI